MKDQEEYLKILSEHQNLIHKVCMIYARTEEDHNDLFQEIVYQGWKSFASFKGESKVSTWLYRVGLYTALNQKKKKYPDLTAYQYELEFEGLEDHKAGEIQRLYQLIDTLHDTDRAIVTLYLDNHSYESISEILGMTVNNVGVRINRIKKKLKEKWN